MNPNEVNGGRQKGAYICGMRDYHSGNTDCPYKGPMMFKYWLTGRQFALENPEINCSKGFKELLHEIQNTTI